MMQPTAGLGFKPEHFAAALPCTAAGLWFEIHAENYMLAGGPRMAMLDALAAHHPISVHGVGLSLASAERPDPQHLLQLKQVVERTQAFVVSEHLAWSRWQGVYYPDLLPVARTHEALQLIARNIEIAQHALQRPLLIENPSWYLRLDTHEWSEPEFLSELVKRTGCGLLVDVNNIFVSTQNIGGSAHHYLDNLPSAAIGEIHLAGHAIDSRGDTRLLIDTHGAPICAEVWALYQYLLARIGTRPTLIERDDNLPEFSALLLERNQAAHLLDVAHHTTSREQPHASIG